MKTILVIEDTPAMRENIAEILQLAPYDIMQAPNGKVGIELARQTHPDLILCDIKMPELDGFGVLHILRKDPELSHVPFIFLTAKADIADFRYGMNLGADDYLAKPFDDLTLLNTVALRLEKGQRGQPVPTSAQPDLASLKRAILNEPNARQTLLDQYPTMPYNRKHRLFTAGNWPTALYFVHQGKVKLFKADAVGNEYITSLFGVGNFVGYMALLEETPYSETAELLDDALICTIPKEDFIALIEHHPDVSRQFLRLLVGDINELQERLVKLAYQSVRKRVAEALLMVQHKFYPRSGDPQPGEPNPNTSLAMSLSRENWSHLVGASTETVIRVLGDLRAEGLIEINGSQIILLDIDKLTRLKR